MEYTKTIFNSTFLNIILLSLYIHLTFSAVKAEDCAISNAFEINALISNVLEMNAFILAQILSLIGRNNLCDSVNVPVQVDA